MMKLVFENGKPVPKANGLKSRGSVAHLAPNAKRQRFVEAHPICRLGAFEMQRQAQVAYKEHTQRKIKGVMDWLDTLS